MSWVVTGSSSSSSSASGVFTYSGHIETGSDKVYVLEESAEFAHTINELVIKTVSGTATVAIKINATAVTGLSAVSVTSTQSTTAATAANTVAAGDRVTITLSSSSTPIDLTFTLKYTR